MPRDLSDIIRDPQPDPHRQFDKKVERLVETPTEKACREFGENIRAFAEVMKDLQGELEQEVETAHGVIVKNGTRRHRWQHTLIASFSNLDEFIDGKYPIDSEDFRMGLVIARNTKTGEWVDGKMPHISDFTVVKSKHVSHGTYKVWAAAKDGWKAELILDRHQLSQFLSPGATIHWGEIFYLTYKLTQPNGKNLRNHNPLAVRRRWSRNSRFGSAGRGPRP